MRVLIACEESQVVTATFRAKGHEAYSCDILPTSGDRLDWHIQGDITGPIRNQEWDLIIAHPPCTYMCNSGVRWLKTEPGRMQKVIEAANLFKTIWYLQYAYPRLKIAIENPIPHKYAALPKYSQIVQPWQFGHGETKATCLWLYNLPLLKPTNIVEGREGRIWKMPPGPDRTKMRSKTYEGIAQAMADQWGHFPVDSIDLNEEV